MLNDVHLVETNTYKSIDEKILRKTDVNSSIESYENKRLLAMVVNVNAAVNTVLSFLPLTM
jgi:hypothetical protein